MEGSKDKGPMDTAWDRELCRRVMDACRLVADLIGRAVGDDGDAATAAEAQESAAVPEESKAPETVAVTLSEVRAELARRAAEGHGEQVRSLLERYGSRKLSGIPPEKYGQLMRDAERMAVLGELKAVLEEKRKEGLEDVFPALFEHHFATGPDDLRPEYYEAFLRDARELRHAG